MGLHAKRLTYLQTANFYGGGGDLANIQGLIKCVLITMKQSLVVVRIMNRNMKKQTRPNIVI